MNSRLNGERALTRGGAELVVDTLFATPLLMLALPDADEINASIRDAVLSREHAQKTETKTNIGGFQSTPDVCEWGGPMVRRITDTALALADRYTAVHEGPKPRWHVAAWANVNRADDYNLYHIHASSFWSGVYYVSTPELGGEDAGGEIQFHDPLGPAVTMYAPNLGFDVPHAETVGTSKCYWPEPGLFLMFPSWLPHSVSAFKGEGERISVAFNLLVCP